MPSRRKSLHINRFLIKWEKTKKEGKYIMPKKHSYYKIAAYYSLEGFGLRLSDDNNGPSRSFNEFSKNWRKRLDDLGKQVAAEPDNSDWKTVYKNQYDSMAPMVKALNDFEEASTKLYAEARQVTYPTTAAKKAALEKAAKAAEEFDKAYQAYMEAHPYLIQENQQQRDFYRMWNDENFDKTGDDVLEETGYNDPRFSPDYVPEAPDPFVNIPGYVPDAPPVPNVFSPINNTEFVEEKPEPRIFQSPLPMGTNVHQLVSQLAVGISPEGKAIGDAELLVTFHRSLYEQYNKYQTQRQNALQAGEDVTALDQKMGVVSSLYTSIQDTLNAAQKIKIAALSPEADVEAGRQALSEAAAPGILMAHQFKNFKNVCKDDLNDIAGYKEFNTFWNKGMMRGGDKIMAAMGLGESSKDRQTLQDQIKDDQTSWPKIIKQDAFSRKLRFDDDAYLRLTKVLGSAAMTAQDPNVKEMLSSAGKNMLTLLNGVGKEPYYEKQLLRNAAALPQILKDNYEFLKQKANEDPEYGENLFNKDLKKLSTYLDLDISELHLPEPVAEEIPPRASWKGQIRNIKMQKDPTLEEAPGQLAKLLVCSVNESKNAPYSAQRMNKAIDELKESQMFKQIAKNPDRCIKLFKEGNPTDIINGMTHPFQAADPDSKRKALEKLKIYKDSGFLFPTKGRSTEWKNFYNAIDDIDLSKPETYDQQLENIFNADEAYMKGKKALSKDVDRNERVNECMDVMQIVSEVSPYVKDRVNQIVDRTNHVRTRWGRQQPTFDMDDIGSASFQAVNKIHGMIEAAKEDPQKMEALKNEPKFNKQSLVHPEMDRADYGWEVINKQDVQAQQQNDAPQINV